MSTVKDKIVTVGNKEYLKLSTVFEDLDWGDYKITESGSESRYQFDKISGLSGAVSGTEKDGTPYVSFIVDYDHKEFTGTFENRTNPASVKIIKYGNNKKDKLKGVTFKIEKILADKSTELTATKETDANGEITFSDLDPERLSDHRNKDSQWTQPVKRSDQSNSPYRTYTKRGSR
ncbi:MAG: prealbumin-like fold domain-containing protein [Anaerobutyricum soehngenii]